jgi:hypothetical protein
MSLAELRLEDLRCLPRAQLTLHPRLNLITGDNGSGKTSVLEAIYLLGPRSILPYPPHRTADRHASQELRVFGRIEARDHISHSIGLGCSRAQGLTARIDGQDVASHWPHCPSCSRSRSSTREFIGWWRRGRCSGVAGSTGQCSTWNQTSCATGRDTAGPCASATRRSRAGRCHAVGLGAGAPGTAADRCPGPAGRRAATLLGNRTARPQRGAGVAGLLPGLESRPGSGRRR